MKDNILNIQLENLYFWSLLKHASLMLGNSSSGIMETPSLKLATIDIGDRQKGRLASSNIIHSVASKKSITEAIHFALSEDFISTIKDCINPYDAKSEAASTIADYLAKTPLGLPLLRKEFYPVSETKPYHFMGQNFEG